MKEVLESGESVATEEKFVKAGARVSVDVLESPFRVKQGGELRARRGWHQTWKREDEVDQAKVWGYVNIREPRRNSAGDFVITVPGRIVDGKKLPDTEVLGKEEAGKESGPVMKRLELGTREQYEYAMEVDEKLYQRDIEAMAREGNARINQSGIQFREVIENANSAAGRRGGLANVVDDDTGYEEQAEEPVVIGKRKKVE